MYEKTWVQNFGKLSIVRNDTHKLIVDCIVVLAVKTSLNELFIENTVGTSSAVLVAV